LVKSIAKNKGLNPEDSNFILEAFSIWYAARKAVWDWVGAF